MIFAVYLDSNHYKAQLHKNKNFNDLKECQLFSKEGFDGLSHQIKIKMELTLYGLN